MAYISYIKLWGSDIDGIVSKSDKLQDLNISQFELHDIYKKDEKKQQILKLLMIQMILTEPI